MPVNAPVNPVDVTDTKPAIVVAAAPNAIAVVPTVTELLVRPPFGMPVKLVPVNVGVVVQLGAPAVSARTPVPCARNVVAPAPV